MNVDIVVRVDCFDMALIFLLFFSIFCTLYTVLQFFCWSPLALMEKGDFTRNYCHDNCDSCFFDEVKHMSWLLLKKRAENPQGTRILLERV